MKGYRVVPLTSEGNIPDEIGEIHHFSISIERSEWWAGRLLYEDNQFVPNVYDYAANGHAIVAVEVEDVKPDTLSRYNAGMDFHGKIISMEVISVHPCREVERKRAKRFFISTILGFIR